ncbi:MAG: hypothetical protein OXI32_09445 [bacterium]|nr:hypothetical protein [bacterium]
MAEGEKTNSGDTSDGMLTRKADPSRWVDKSNKSGQFTKIKESGDLYKSVPRER